MKKVIIKKLRKMMIDKAISSLEDQKNKTPDKQTYLDVFNSGVYVDLERIRAASINLAIRAIRAAEKQIGDIN